MSESFNPASVTIRSAILKSFDGTQRDITLNFIGGFEINQSMDAVNYSGHISVLDTAGVLESLPIRGEETLELEIISHDLDTRVRIVTRVHRVTDILPTPSSNGVTYKLHFISDLSFKASTYSITKAYKTSVNTIAKKIFEDYFGELSSPDYLDQEDRSRTLPFATARYPISGQDPERNFYIQPTVGLQNLIIPRLTPSEAMYFIASRGFNSETPSQTFRFFETLENYYFCTDEYFLRDIRAEDELDLFYAPSVDYTPEDREQQINRIDSLRILSRGIDTSIDLYSGAYRSEVIELDFIRRRKDTIVFEFDNARYFDMSGTPVNQNDDSTQPHTEAFREATFGEDNVKKQFMVFRNFSREGDIPSALNNDLKLSEIIQNRVSYYHHLNNVVLSAGLKGRFDIRPGQIVNLRIKSFDGTENTISRNTISGRYLVKTTTHVMEEGTLNTGLTLVKFDWSVPADERRIESPDMPAGSTNTETNVQ